jgi:hypothetical protein
MAAEMPDVVGPFECHRRARRNPTPAMLADERPVEGRGGQTLKIAVLVVHVSKLSRDTLGRRDAAHPNAVFGSRRVQPRVSMRCRIRHLAGAVP